MHAFIGVVYYSPVTVDTIRKGLRGYSSALDQLVRSAVLTCTLAFAIVATGGGHQGDGGTPDPRPIREEIRHIEAALPHIADRGAALYLLARRYTALGDLDRARSLLTECLSLDEGFEPDTPALAPLQRSPDIHDLADRFRRRHPPVHRASVGFTVAEKDLFPEGLAFDADRHTFYLSSEYHNKIVAIDRSRRASDFVDPDRYHLSPVGGLRVDPVDHSVWAATDSAEFVHIDPAGQLLERFSAPEPGPHILNDLVVRPRDVYLTDTRGHLVYRFDRAAHTFEPLTFHRPLFSPNGITFSQDGRLLLVADDVGVLAVELGTGRTFDVSPGQRNTLAGIDGLYWYRDGLVGVQYGTGLHRVMRWRLSADARTVRSSDVLEYRTDLVSFPTTGAIVGNDFYFLANTGIGNLRNGQIADRTKLEPVHVAVVKLR
jgi:sugar lactone lactonase YvrE